MMTNENVDLIRGIDHVGVGVAAIVHDGSGRILLMKRGAKEGKWDICGGAIEFGESISDALKRELKEELCTEPLDVEFLKAYDAHRVASGQKTHWVQLLHAVRIDPQNVTIGEPHKIEEINWFDDTSLPSPLHSQFNKNYETAKEKGYVR